MRRILVLKPFIVTRSNGGEIALLERLQLFQSWGVEIQISIAQPQSQKSEVLQILQSLKTPILSWELPERGSYKVDDLLCKVEFSEKFHPYDFAYQSSTEDFFIREIEAFKPDLVISHYTDFFATTAGLRWNPDHLWIDQTDDEYPRTSQLQNYPSILQPYEKSKHFIVASQFMKDSVGRSFPRSSIHELPNIIASIQEFSERPYSPSAEAPWIFVNPTAVKGVEFILQLARECPNDRFLFLGNWSTEVPKDLSPNIRFIPRQDDIRPILHQGRGLLMPSVWNEAFGRMPLEAMAAGLPVISSNRGALPETVGNGGIVLPLEIAVWKSALAQSANALQSYVMRGYQRVYDYRSATNQTYAALKKSWNL